MTKGERIGRAIGAWYDRHPVMLLIIRIAVIGTLVAICGWALYHRVQKFGLLWGVLGLVLMIAFATAAGKRKQAVAEAATR